VNAIQSLGKSVIVQPKPTVNDSTGFSTLLNALGIEMSGQESGRAHETAGESELEQGDDKTPNSEAELPLNLLMITNGAHPLDIQGSQASSSPKLQGYLESIENVQVKSGSQQGLILTGFTKQELMDIEQFGKQLPLKSVVSKVNESSLQLQGKNDFDILPEFSNQEWLEMQQDANEVLANPKPLEKVQMIEVAKGQEVTKSLEIIKQLTAEQSSHQKNLEVTVDQPPQLEEQKAIVEGEQRPVLEEGEKARSQFDQTKTEQLENLEQPSAEPSPIDDVQTEEKPDGFPLVKQSNDAPVKEAPVPARYLNTELSEMITERMQLSKNGDETNIRIKLSPENLGQLDIRLTTLDGKVTAHIVTATTGAKELIESQIHQLRQTLVQQGIQLDKVEVVQQSQGPQQPFMQDGRGEQGQQFQQGKQRHERKGEYELEDNPLVTNEREESTSGGINYAI